MEYNNVILRLHFHLSIVTVLLCSDYCIRMQKQFDFFMQNTDFQL